MNKEFEQWAESQIGLLVSNAFRVYHYLQDNPHLLREDGEKEIVLEHEPPSFYGAQDILSPKEPKEDWTVLAEKMFLRYPKISRSGMKAALTEGMQEAYERGKEEYEQLYHDAHEERSLLKLQLAEKDKDVRSLNILAGERHDSIVDLAYQLTAAKVKITRLEQINCDLELALKNL